DAATVDEVARNATELRGERGEGERLARDVEHVVAARLGLQQRGVELVEMRVGQLEEVRICELVGAPLAARLERREVGCVHRVAPLVGADCGPRTRRPGSGSRASPFS